MSDVSIITQHAFNSQQIFWCIFWTMSTLKSRSLKKASPEMGFQYIKSRPAYKHAATVYRCYQSTRTYSTHTIGRELDKRERNYRCTRTFRSQSLSTYKKTKKTNCIQHKHTMVANKQILDLIRLAQHHNSQKRKITKHASINRTKGPLDWVMDTCKTNISKVITGWLVPL